MSIQLQQIPDITSVTHVLYTHPINTTTTVVKGSRDQRCPIHVGFRARDRLCTFTFYLKHWYFVTCQTCHSSQNTVFQCTT